jgi:hypothetical protein
VAGLSIVRDTALSRTSFPTCKDLLSKERETKAQAQVVVTMRWLSSRPFPSDLSNSGWSRGQLVSFAAPNVPVLTPKLLSSQ